MHEGAPPRSHCGPAWWFDRTIEGVVVCAFITFVILSFVQVVLRYGFGRPLTWAEEVSRYLFVWVVFVGAGIAARYKAHIALDFLVSRFTPRVQRRVAMLVGALSFVMLLLVFVWYGWFLTQVSMRQESPATGIPVGWATLAIPVGGIVAVINLLRAAGEEPPSGAES